MFEIDKSLTKFAGLNVLKMKTKTLKISEIEKMVDCRC